MSGIQGDGVHSASISAQALFRRPCIFSNVLSVFGRGAGFISSRAAEFALASVPAIVEHLGTAPDCVLVGR
eukprot:5007676-Pyramimonas_sp.AAC.1